MAKMDISNEKWRTLLQRLPPPLSEDQCKGQVGRVAIVGGSLGSTGAPFFAGIGALRCGADQAFVFCTRDAASTIGSYSPELLVLPFLDAEHGRSLTTSWLTEVHSLVVGPGLGEDVAVHSLVVSILDYVRENKTLSKISLVFDGDGIGLLADNKDVVADYAGRVYLTPNATEIKKLASVYFGRHDIDTRDDAALGELAVRINANAVLILKGREDRIVANGALYTCSEPGGLRRVGGQGDLLSGFLGLFAYWALLLDGCDVDSEEQQCLVPAQAIAAYAACFVTRVCSRFAFESTGRSTITSDMIGHIQKAFAKCFVL